MKTAGYHIEGYGPGKACCMVGEAGTDGADGFVFVRKVRGVYRIAIEPNRGAIPDELLGRKIPCRVIVGDDKE